MGKVPGLTRKKSAYFYIRRIPKDLAEHFSNKQQICDPLNTTDFRTACARARQKAVETDRLFVNARLGISQESRPRAAVTIDQLHDAARLHLYTLERQTTDWGEIGREEALNSIQHDLSFVGSPDQDVWREVIHPTAMQLRDKLGLALEPGDRLWLEFTALVRRAEQEHLERELDRLSARSGLQPRDHLFAYTFAHTEPPKVLNPQRPTLSEVINHFETDPTRRELTDSAAKKYILPFAVLREVVGDQRHVAEITRADCASAHELLSQLPRNYIKRKDYSGKSLSEVAALAKGDGSTLLAAGTVQVYATHLSAFFNWAVQKGIVDVNPASRVGSSSKKQPSSRLPFSPQELEKLLDCLPSWSKDNPGRYWLPLIGLTMGLRLGEIVLLTTDDIQVVDGVDAITLRKTAERRLKTRGSQRVVPVHKALKELGFLRMVDARKSKGKFLLFDLDGETQAKRVDLFQKRFSYLLRTQVNVRKGVSFHSFRHGFRDELRNVGAPIDVTRALGGWALNGGIEERYGQGARASVLSTWLNKIDFAELKVVLSGDTGS
jgi:integrase